MNNTQSTRLEALAMFSDLDCRRALAFIIGGWPDAFDAALTCLAADKDEYQAGHVTNVGGTHTMRGCPCGVTP